MGARLASLDHVTNGFANSWLSGLSNAGKPKHSFVIAVREALFAAAQATTTIPIVSATEELVVVLIHGC